GTGKTLTARGFAGTIGRKIKQINVPEVLSKWWGETENNISRLFKKANESDSVLILDEADSLVHKRAIDQDRQHHNSHINVMLTEIERFNGILIMTTNFADNLDPALERRVDIKLEFPRPEPGERIRIWEELIPARLPLANDVNFEWLGGEFELSGGEIRNVIKNAARVAMSRNNPRVEFRDILDSIEMERLKSPEPSVNRIGFFRTDKEVKS
ncbi:AAA family ATPase, partial [candidate division WOR-3 bacterium]|nr:AAA family ATPase [candidate division WOR-3 bacterium]MBD3365274.1 AAA family ATPase [candidate division WOR-3 bacterium]